MNRQPLSDELPYRFVRPRLDATCLWAARWIMARSMRRDHKIEEVTFEGEAALRERVGRGDGVLLCPNHTDHADSHLLFALSRRVGLPFYYMIAYQILQGPRRWFLPRVGAFPVDREGADLAAFKMGVDLLARGRNPLVVFPEGEIHHLGDRVTPLREGALALATTAARRATARGATVWLVPVAIKYRYVAAAAALPALHDALDALERHANWYVDRDRPMMARIYRYAEAMMAMKEVEFLGAAQSGSLPGRLDGLREHLLGRIEARRLPGMRRPGASAADVPDRVKEIRRACLAALIAPGVTEADRRSARADLHHAFVAFQTFSYPGDYLHEAPTIERAAETIMKFEEDFLGQHEVTPHAPRRAIIRVGEPVDVGARLATFARPRQAVGSLTAELEQNLQALLDAIGPGTRLPDHELAQPGS